MNHARTTALDRARTARIAGTSIFEIPVLHRPSSLQVFAAHNRIYRSRHFASHGFSNKHDWSDTEKEKSKQRLSSAPSQLSETAH
jgi:spore coat polysaccharide biosynthesis predicted glycosyltransferase SpsG